MTVNTITAEVQQVTTRSKAKTADWVEQDEIRKVAKEWVTKANASNVEWMRLDGTPTTVEEDTIPEINPILQAP